MPKTLACTQPAAKADACFIATAGGILDRLRIVSDMGKERGSPVRADGLTRKRTQMAKGSRHSGTDSWMKCGKTPSQYYGNWGEPGLCRACVQNLPRDLYLSREGWPTRCRAVDALDVVASEWRRRAMALKHAAHRTSSIPRRNGLGHPRGGSGHSQETRSGVLWRGNETDPERGSPTQAH